MSRDYPVADLLYGIFKAWHTVRVLDMDLQVSTMLRQLSTCAVDGFELVLVGKDLKSIG